jgi:hypothetical protein
LKLFAEEPYDEVYNNGQYSTDHQAGHDREEEPEISLLQQYIAGQPPQKRNLAPEREKYTQYGNKNSDEYQELSQIFKAGHIFLAPPGPIL